MSDKIPEFGKLKQIPIRDIWKREDQNFTPWLKDNISALGDALRLELHAQKTELPVGKYYLDLLAEDDTGRNVVIENQFNETNHDHLGKCLTYAAGCDASIVIWVVETANDEHRAAVEWLNRKTDTETEFYLVKIEVIKIDESRPAYQFIPVVTPNYLQKQQRQRAVAPTPEDLKRENYFRQFDEDMEETVFSTSYKPRQKMKRRRGYWCKKNCLAYMHEIYDIYASVYLEFNGDVYKKESCIKLRNQLMSRKEAIDAKLKLEWDDSGLGYTKIGISREVSLDSEESLAETRAWAVENMLKLAEAIPPEMLQEIADAVAEQENESA